MGRRRNRTSRRSAAVETQANASASAGCLPGFIPPHLQAARAGTHWATFAGSGQFKQVISSATTSRNDQATAPAFAGCAAGFVPPHLQVVRVGNGGYASPSGTPSVTSGGSSSVFRKAETAEEEQSSVYVGFLTIREQNTLYSLFVDTSLPLSGFLETIIHLEM